MPKARPRVAILMGSDSDLDVMLGASDALGKFGVEFEMRILSAHRTPQATAEFAQTASERGIEVLIAGAGGAAHLAGVLAAHTTLPVIGVPVQNGPLNGFDALLATVQMPGGIPVATVGINRADNAALLAIQILANSDEDLGRQMLEYRQEMRDKVAARDKALQARVSATRTGS